MTKIHKNIVILTMILTFGINLFGACTNNVDMGAKKVTTTSTTFSDDKQLITKKYVDNSLVGGDGVKGFMADHEGWLHPTIKIGTKTWMADNLYVTTFSGGGDHAMGDAMLAYNSSVER